MVGSTENTRASSLTGKEEWRTSRSTVPTHIVMQGGRTRTTIMNEKEISIELSHCLSEWGVPNDQAHLEFRRGVIVLGIGYFRARARVGDESCSILEDNSSSFFQTTRILCDNSDSTDISAAYEYYLRQDISMPLFCYEDMINMDASEPYYRWYNINTRNIEYKLKPKFQGMSSQYLYPFDRFRYEKITKEEHFFSKWLVDNGDKAEIGGRLMEVYLGCHVLQHEACFHCSKKSIKWNGSSNSSWQALLCQTCNATYAVKTKANMKAVESEFCFNKISGGSFEEFCKIHNSQLQPKMFCVVLPRKSVATDVQNRVYPVYIAEITKGVPQLYHNAFNKRLPKMIFKTRISVAINTKKKWFDLPQHGNPVDIWSIGKKVFVDRFSKSKYDEMKALFGFGDHNDGSSDEESDCGTKNEIADAIANITI